jgi:hypothetical protein
MDIKLHNITHLFAQLGLPNARRDISDFILLHNPLDISLALCDAPFWSLSQANFLREQIEYDADWAGIVDRLDCSLRQS